MNRMVRKLLSLTLISTLLVGGNVTGVMADEQETVTRYVEGIANITTEESKQKLIMDLNAENMIEYCTYTKLFDDDFGFINSINLRHGYYTSETKNLSETMDYCNPLIGSDYKCIGLNGENYVPMVKTVKKTDSGEYLTTRFQSLSKEEELNATYKEFLKDYNIKLDSDLLNEAKIRALQIGSGYDIEKCSGYSKEANPKIEPIDYNVWTYNGYGPEQSSEHAEAEEKWKEARKILADFQKEHKYVAYGFAFAIPNISLNKYLNVTSWRDFKGTYVLLYKEITEEEMKNMKTKNILAGTDSNCNFSIQDCPCLSLRSCGGEYLANGYQFEDFSTTQTQLKQIEENYSTGLATATYKISYPEKYNFYMEVGKEETLQVMEYRNKQYVISKENRDSYDKDIVPTYHDSDLTWTSSNPRVATVSGGVVTAKKQGRATISTNFNGKTYKCQVTVYSKDKQFTEDTYVSENGETINVRLKDYIGVKQVKWGIGYNKNEYHATFLETGLWCINNTCYCTVVQSNLTGKTLTIKETPFDEDKRTKDHKSHTDKHYVEITFIDDTTVKLYYNVTIK